MKPIKFSAQSQTILWMFFLLISPCVYAQAVKLNQNSNWSEHKFSGKTNYEWVGDTLIAKSKASASGLFYEVDIDLNKTPILTWQWKIDEPITLKNQQTKATDDFAARIYVIKKNPVLFWRTKAINYVWSNQIKQFTHWYNPFTSNAVMVSMQTQESSGWRTERVNIQKDFKQYLNIDIDKINGIAIMTDSDNSGLSAQARFKNIQLLPRNNSDTN